MKKLLVFTAFVFALVLFASSCRSHESCPAYKNGSAQKPSTEQQNRS